ncbi:polysaccharide biosynthesis/export family protein [Marinirhabdus gelatinilytica]|uniref:Polysaccharide export outer membrane protein n=1 Tax=Marinirhabdus gelatinilytica TaxID=1703343 RepID=A0A370QG44_9FLAO|nr:polysaccharide biosynthesis/export family protein [Marinirhabdus gelatinilytica]RDK87338.1 polysaccharide export outer membrane protein [Marinirhabdus gelatinilytica]
MKNTLFVLLLSLFLGSCATKKEIVYFQDASELNNQKDSNFFEPIIEANDILHITVSSLDGEVVAPFMKNTTNSNAINGRNPLLEGYLVNPEGYVQFPVLGKIKLSGKTRAEAIGDLTKRISEYVKDAVVDVRIMNFKITVLGAVNNPSVFTIGDERVSIPQALGLAGDLSQDGRRENIMIIRQEDGKQKVTRVDLTQTDFFKSPYYFLKQNDIIYVEPSLKGVKKSGFIPDVPALLSLVTIVLSTVILLTR